MSILKERIKHIRSTFKIGSQEDLAKLLKVNGARIKSIETGRVKELSAMEASLLVKNFNLNLDWLLTGNGEMLLKNDSSNKLDSYQIDLLNVRAGAGEGIYNYVIETVDTISLDKNFFKTPINTSKVKGIQVDGDSMEPTLRDGDYVLIDENITFGTNGIYAIQYGGQLLIKRLQFKIDGSILIISDNKKYEKEIFNPQENQLPFQVIGIKILSIQR